MCARNSAGNVTFQSNGSLVDQLITLSEARPMDRITVTGHHTLDVFLGLCRRGFLNAACRTAAEGPHTAENSPDSLWIVGANAAELRTLIARCARDLHKGGSLAVSLHIPGAANGALVLGEVLTRCGFAPVRRMIFPNRVLLLCEKQANANSALAA